VRTTTYLVVGGAAAVAAYLTPPAPRPVKPLAAIASSPRAVEAPLAPVWRSRVDTLGRGESITAVLERAGMSRDHASRALREAGRSTCAGCAPA
jgi:hypothetical protein